MKKLTKENHDALFGNLLTGGVYVEVFQKYASSPIWNIIKSELYLNPNMGIFTHRILVSQEVKEALRFTTR